MASARQAADRDSIETSTLHWLVVRIDFPSLPSDRNPTNVASLRYTKRTDTVEGSNGIGTNSCERLAPAKLTGSHLHLVNLGKDRPKDEVPRLPFRSNE